MKLPSNRSLRRWTAVSLTLSAVAAVGVAPSARAVIPECAYLMVFYSTPAKTFEIGRRYVTPKSCGCVEENLGQTSAYTTISPYNGCWVPD